MSHLIQVPTPFADAQELAENFASRVDAERLMLPHHEEIPEGVWVQFTVSLGDGSPALNGVGRCTGAFDNGEDRAPEHRFDVVMDELQFDEPSQAYFGAILDYRAAEEGAEPGLGQDEGVAHEGVEHGAAEYGAAEHGAAEHGAAEYGAAEHGAAEHGAAEHGAAEHGAAEHGAAELHEAHAGDYADEVAAPGESSHDFDADATQAVSFDDLPPEAGEIQPGYSEAETPVPTGDNETLDAEAIGYSPGDFAEPPEDPARDPGYADPGYAEPPADEYGAAAGQVDATADVALPVEDHDPYAEHAAADHAEYDQPHEPADELAAAEAVDADDVGELEGGDSEFDAAFAAEPKLAIPETSAIYQVSLPVAPGSLPSPHAVEQVLTRRLVSSSWSPEPASRMEPSPSSGYFQYAVGAGLPVPAEPPRPAMDPGWQVHPAPRSSDPYAAPAAIAEGYAAPSPAAAYGGAYEGAAAQPGYAEDGYSAEGGEAYGHEAAGDAGQFDAGQFDAGQFDAGAYAHDESGGAFDHAAAADAEPGGEAAYAAEYAPEAGGYEAEAVGYAPEAGGYEAEAGGYEAEAYPAEPYADGSAEATGQAYEHEGAAVADEFDVPNEPGAATGDVDLNLDVDGVDPYGVETAQVHLPDDED